MYSVSVVREATKQELMKSDLSTYGFGSDP